MLVPWVNGAEEAEIDQLVLDLSADSFQTREAATLKLWEIGDEAIPLLREAILSDDPERAFRASEILEKVELRITPEASGEILTLIQSYRNAPLNQKDDFLNQLKRQKAYYQILKLYSMESPEVKKSLSTSIRGVAITGARDAIARDDTEAAIQLLRMSTGGERDLMALASIHRTMGDLDSELENPNPPENVPTDLWKLTLLRASGDVGKAAELAAKTKQVRLLAALRVLSGDPTLWLQQNGMGNNRQQAQDAYIDIALKRWKGEVVGKKDFAPLIRQLDSHDDDERAHAMTSLASLGRLKLVEKVQTKQNPSASFLYYLSQENIAEALKAIGFDPENPDYTAWFQQRFMRINGDEAGDGHGDDSALPELVLVAGFLERRGLHQELSKALSEPFSKYAKNNENDFLDLLGTLFEATSGAPRFASDQGAEWAGDDEVRWNQLFSTALGEDDEVPEWLNWIRELKPEISNREVLDSMLALYHRSIAPGDLRKKWMDAAWGAVELTENQDLKKAYINRILSLSISQEDVRNTLKAWDMLEPEQQVSEMWGSIDKFLSAAGRWKEAAEILENVGNNRSSSSPEVHAYLAVNFRRAGLEGRAREHEKWVEKLALGYAPSCARIGACYAYGGDFQRALKWRKRAVIQANVPEGEFVALLDDYAASLMRNGNWEVAASCSEALVQVYASQQYMDGALSGFARERLKADLAKAMAILPGQKERALKILGNIHTNFATDGILADDFFPLLRKAGLIVELDQWFGESWKRITAVIAKYPESQNSRNTAAWFASRSGLKLDIAEEFLKEALQYAPEQPAYLDTMAEIQFAKGDRKAAIEWSNTAVEFSPLDEMIRQQNDRFKNDPIPLRSGR